MPEILVVTGTCGVGKTTVCRAWAARRRGALISGDEVRHWILCDELRLAQGFQHRLVVKTTISAATELLGQGIDVALDNVWFPDAMESIRQGLAHFGKMRFVWLQCQDAENQRRDKLRSSGSVMGSRVGELLQELKAADWPDYLRVIDSSALSIDETLGALELLPAMRDATR